MVKQYKIYRIKKVFLCTLAGVAGFTFMVSSVSCKELGEKAGSKFVVEVPSEEESYVAMVDSDEEKSEGNNELTIIETSEEKVEDTSENNMSSEPETGKVASKEELDEGLNEEDENSWIFRYCEEFKSLSIEEQKAKLKEYDELLSMDLSSLSDEDYNKIQKKKMDLFIEIYGEECITNLAKEYQTFNFMSFQDFIIDGSGKNEVIVFCSGAKISILCTGIGLKVESLYTPVTIKEAEFNYYYDYDDLALCSENKKICGSVWSYDTKDFWYTMIDYGIEKDNYDCTKQFIDYRKNRPQKS